MLQKGVPLYVLLFVCFNEARGQNHHKLLYAIEIENGISINYSKFTSNNEYFRIPGPKRVSFSGYYYGLGIEIKQNKFVYAIKLKKINVGTTLNFIPPHPYNERTLFAGLWRPCFNGNLAFGRQFNLKKLSIKLTTGVDYALYYKIVTRYSVGFYFENQTTTDSLSFEVLSNNKAGPHLSPNAEIVLNLPITLKGKYKFSIGYNFIFNYGLRSLRETTFLFSFKDKNTAVSVNNRGTYQCHSLSVQYYLN